MKSTAVIFTMFCLACSISKPVTFTLEEQKKVTDALLISAAIVDQDQVWFAGTKSTVMRTKDGGTSWKVFRHPTVDTFQFRDIHVFSEGVVAVLSIGEGSASQIHLFSEEVGWKTTFIMDHPEGFLNSIDFWDKDQGLAFGDSFDGKPYILQTMDGGKSWNRISASKLPDAGKGEGGFASSGSCIEMGSNGRAWIATGAGGHARILKTSNYGRSWSVSSTPMIKGEMAGIMSIHFRDEKNGIITGGDLAQKDAYTANVFFSADGGESWQIAKQPLTKGAFYGGDQIEFRKKIISVLCGPNGADLALKEKGDWQTIATDDLWVADLDERGLGWMAGKEGKILKIGFK